MDVAALAAELAQSDLEDDNDEENEEEGNKEQEIGDIPRVNIFDGTDADLYEQEMDRVLEGIDPVVEEQITCYEHGEPVISNGLCATNFDSEERRSPTHLGQIVRSEHAQEQEPTYEAEHLRLGNEELDSTNELDQVIEILRCLWHCPEEHVIQKLRQSPKTIHLTFGFGKFPASYCLSFVVRIYPPRL